MTNLLSYNGGEIGASKNPMNYTINYVPSLILTGISSSLSILGSVFIFLQFFIERRRSFTYRLLVFLTLADCLSAFGNILGVIRYAEFDRDVVISENEPCDSDPLCVIQSFITVFACLASFWWTFFTAFNHFLHQLDSRCLEKNSVHVLCHLCGWGCPVTIAVIALSYDVLGEGFSGGSGPWCWIKDCTSSSPSPGAWMAITGKGWEITAYFVTFAIYMLSKFNNYRFQRSRDQLLLPEPHSSTSYGSLSMEGHSVNQDVQEDERFGLLWIFLYMYLTRVWGTISCR
ncbi:G-protein coupled receptor 157-like isoform X2 [Ostrea edulis]|uniref:G-protein coupled receptor 157-like isoform X2 n=1 Tax=Ostrea edulis TaxID=37623 RepID=UPI0024AE8EB0|nr:G-protein coupled receptor 157-like isoform X2 [Ostrea edulis]